MSRFRYGFKILTNRKAFRDLKESSPLRKLLETIRAELSERPAANPDTVEFTSDGLNKVYDARFICYASGSDLDTWGETLDLKRNPSESDSAYRNRLLNELRDFTEALTIKGLKSRVHDIIGADPAIVEHHSLAPDWPIDWTATAAPWTSWVPWDMLVDFLLVIPDTVNSSALMQIADAVADIKLASARCLIVSDSGNGYYNLRKQVD